MLLFLIFWSEHSQIQGWRVKIRKIEPYPDFVTLTLNLTVFWLEYQKKKHSLHSYFFAKNPNLQSEFKNSDFKNLTSHWPLTLKKVHEGQPQSILTALTTFTGQFQSRIPAIPWEFLKKANSVGRLMNKLIIIKWTISIQNPCSPMGISKKG